MLIPLSFLTKVKLLKGKVEPGKGHELNTTTTLTNLLADCWAQEALTGKWNLPIRISWEAQSLV